ncbi:class I SAM-dependent methyltransferase [Metabacillus sp. GX 13764]|uniref:class I SAM-dependent methyltransferase n=1 Tax=Metabacillus kandeliae TaxID=2900151 RepID=UPI001E430FBA|nr:class I SAM-dependent methyltransferase [Metabacillus kandeliae]MCD7036078.1 class I SAM-dependent methyltransferase [Metabacillus kandeliae]
MLGILKRSFSKPKGFFGSVAGHIMALENRTINKWTISRLKIKPGDCVLEVGFGPGYGMEHILKNYPAVKLDGLDASETMKEQAEKRLQKYVEEGTVKFMVCDVERAELEHSHYHKILSVNNYTIWKNPQNGLKRLCEALKPGGRMAITMQPREEGASPERTREFGRLIEGDMRTCGFQNITVKYKKVHPELTVCVTADKPK